MTLQNSDLLATVDGLLIGIEGVLLHGNEVLPGAHESIAAIHERKLPHRFITNTTIYCRYTLLDRLRALDFRVEIGELYTATYAAAKLLRERGAKRYYPLLLPDAQLEFSGIEVDEDQPEFVVVGDMGAGFTFSRLNIAMRALLNGAKLIALHKKRLWRTEDGLFMDAGPFVVALEYAAGVSAEVLGLPNSAYFGMALAQMGLPPHRVAMIGDDIEADIRGAQNLGLQGWLVKTGRFRKEDLRRGIWPDRILNSITDLIIDL